MGEGYVYYIYYEFFCEFNDLLKMFPNLENDIKKKYQNDLDKSNILMSEYLTKYGLIKTNDEDDEYSKEGEDINYNIRNLQLKINYIKKKLNNIDNFYMLYDDDDDDNYHYDDDDYFPIKIDNINIYLSNNLCRDRAFYDKMNWGKYIVGCEIDNGDDTDKLAIFKKNISTLTDKKPLFMSISYLDT